MPTPESVRGDSFSDLNNSNPPSTPPRRDHPPLSFLFILFLISASLLLYLLRPDYFNLKRFSGPRQFDSTQKIRVKVTNQELDKAYELEKFLRLTGDFSTPSSEPAIDPSLRTAAQERVNRRKILEAEAGNLKIDLVRLRKETQGQSARTDDGREIPEDLASLFSYDKSLRELIRRKVEGDAKLITVMVDFPNQDLSAEAQTVSQKLYESLRQNPHQDLPTLLDEERSQISPKLNLSFQVREFSGPPASSAQSEAHTPYLSGIAGRSYFFRMVTESEKRLGVGFDEWYQNVRKKYL